MKENIDEERRKLLISKTAMFRLFDDETGRLMHDFSCTNPDDMNSSVIS